MQAVQQASRRQGTRGDDADLALVMDGLQAEREQGNTVDVAYWRFETFRRQFFAADVPGHEQYTRNMATGASLVHLAVVRVDAEKGVLPQTARHSRIAATMGIRQVVLAVNKLDLVGWDQARFEAFADDDEVVAAETGIARNPGDPAVGARGRQPDAAGGPFAVVFGPDPPRLPEIRDRQNGNPG